MAGDWIKMRMDLKAHPKVVRMASALKADRLRIIGGLYSAWCLFDNYSADGHMEGYNTEIFDEEIGLTGLAAAMISVGWLEQTPEGLVMPRFDAHNGQSAKRRAQDADRKREDRKIQNLSASEADKTRTREEKRREEKDIPPNPQGGGAVVELAKVKRSDNTPYDDIVRLYHETLPELPRVAKLTDKRKAHIRARWSSDPEFQTLAFWEEFFKYVRGSAFLMGQESRFSADLEFLTKESTFLKTFEGKYHNEPQKGKTWN